MTTRTAMRSSTRKPATHERPARREPTRPQVRRSAGEADAGVVDLTRVVEARRRIASGWYDRSDVRKSLVEAVLQEMRGR